MKDQVEESVNYIISCMDSEGNVKVKDELRMIVAIFHIESNQASEKAQESFNKHKKKVVQWNT